MQARVDVLPDIVARSAGRTRAAVPSTARRAASAAPAALRRPDRRGRRRAATARRARAAGTAGPTACPGGTRSRTGPSSDGTSIFAPSAASCTATGTTSADRRLRGGTADAAATWTSMYRSPVCAAVAPGVALARHAHPRAVGKARRHATVSASVRIVAPVAAARRAARLRAAARCRRTCAHGFENTMCPRADRTMPVPWQCAQRASGVVQPPGAAARAAGSCRVTVTCRSPPRIASSNATVSAECRSAPRSGRAVAAARRAGCSTRRTDRRRSTPARRCDADREIEPVEPERRRRRPRRRRRRRPVVVPPPIRIAQRLVRLGDLRGTCAAAVAIARVDVRVIPPRQPPVRALDVGRASRPRSTPRMT